MSDEFWSTVKRQLEELKSARTADDAVRILSRERNPYGDTGMVAGDGFFAGSGSDNTVWDALEEAGWRPVWASAAHHYAMRAPDGSVITYVEGDIYRGDLR